MFERLGWPLVILACAACGRLSAQPSAGEVFDKARQTYARIQTFEAELEVSSFVGDREVRFHGTLKLKRGNRPGVSLILNSEDRTKCVAFYLSDGAAEWSYDPGDRYITQADLPERESSTRSGSLERFLPDLVRFRRDSLRLDEIREQASEQETLYVLEAKDERAESGNLFPYAKFTISSRDWLPREMSLLGEQRKLQMKIRFVEVRTNHEMPDSAFQFRFPDGLPKGVKVRIVKGE